MINAFLELEPKRRRIVTAILLVGLVSALVIYLTAPIIVPDPSGFDPQDSKQYLRQVESVGGKGNELATELRLWLESLWHGERLAGTVACITVFVALIYLAGSRPVISDISD
jgi:hypothetical protein